jgi:photosystem II stability/assembly factor-like uncharacterized protein
MYLKNLKISISFLILSVFFAQNLNAQKWVEMMNNPEIPFSEVQEEFNKYWDGKEIEKGKGWKQFKRSEYFKQNRLNEDGYFVHNTESFYIYKNRLARESASKTFNKDSASWHPLGPFGGADGSGAGRLNCIEFHPTNSNVIFVGAPSGGIWKSTDGGSSWTTNTDELVNLGISDIKINPNNPNIMYAATGDGDGSDTYSFGVLKSVDGGNTWDTTSLFYNVPQQRLVYKLLLNPSNPDIIYAATNFGLYKSIDAAASWTRIKVGSYRDMAFKPGNSDVIYLATSSALFKTTDAGQTWSTPINYKPGVFHAIGRIVLGVTPADSNYLYIVAGKSSDNGFGGLFLSKDGGNTFTTQATTPNLLGWSSNGSDNGGQAWYDLALAVSPSNKALIFVGGVNIWKSNNEGQNWSLSAHWTGNGAPYVHADIHQMKYSPHNNNSVWAATDGGIANSLNNGMFWTEKHDGLNIGQIYRLGASATNSKKIITGWQDNGSNFFSNTSWKKVYGGDGMECIIDYNDNNTMYASLYYGQIKRSVDGGFNWTGITDNINDYGAWVTPYVQDPNTPNTLYAGFRNIWKTTNKGNSWSKISTFTKQLTYVAVAPSNSNVIYATSSSKVYVTQNGGSSWTDISGNSGAGNNTYIAIHPTNPNRVWITKAGFYDGSKVYYSDNAGATWQNVSSNLPNLPANTIVYEKNSPERLYVGTDVGVYVKDSTSSDWYAYSTNLPNVIVNELEIHYPTNSLRAATYGRGLWESPLAGKNNSINSAEFDNIKVNIYPNPAEDFINIEINSTENFDVNYAIYNKLGKLILQGDKKIFNTANININSLSEGIYIIKLQSDKWSKTKSFVKF